MKKCVTVGIPIYRRLQYLPSVLKVVETQDYPHIKLIVSDNGANGSVVEEMVAQHYSRSYMVRQNSKTVPIARHFNQLIDAAAGEYFVLLADDDSISANFVSQLVRKLEDHPEAHVALGRQRMFDERGDILRSSVGTLPDVMDGLEFLEAAWKDCRYRYECFATTLARTESLRRSGGYPPFPGGTHIDDAVLVKLALQGPIAFSNQCAFHWRVDAGSQGWSMPLRTFARDSALFLDFLKRDSRVLRMAAKRPADWHRVVSCVEEMTWTTFRHRWNTIYRDKISKPEWLLAPLRMPFTWRFQKQLVKDAANRIVSRYTSAAPTIGPR